MYVYKMHHNIINYNYLQSDVLKLIRNFIYFNIQIY